ncbi:MAG TPA: hypothetical protein PK715_11775 [Chitinophagales bacterium]|nr:hypothetical protein [Chitinophagales bacterium]
MLKKQWVWLLAVLLLGLSLQPAMAQQKADKKVKKSFSAYRSALLKQKGKKAAKRVSKVTIDYYGSVLQKAVYADSAQVSALPLLDKLMVLSFRNRIPAQKLLTMKPCEAVVYAINNGLIGKESLADLSLGAITYQQNKAQAQILLASEPLPINFIFYRECCRWKIDLTAFFPLATLAIEQTAKNLEMNQNELVQFMLTLEEPYTLNPKVWQPVSKW